MLLGGDSGAVAAKDFPAPGIPATRGNCGGSARGQVDALSDRDAAGDWSGAVLRQTLAWLREDRKMQADRARLSKACCSPTKFAALEGAPAPFLWTCV